MESIGPHHVRVLVLRERVSAEDECWVAQCLEYDLVAQARTLHELQASFRRIFVGQALVDLLHGNEPFANLKPAPVRYWNDYKKALRLAETISLSVPAEYVPSQLAQTPSWIPRVEAVMAIAA